MSARGQTKRAGVGFLSPFVRREIDTCLSSARLSVRAVRGRVGANNPGSRLPRGAPRRPMFRGARAVHRGELEARKKTGHISSRGVKSDPLQRKPPSRHKTRSILSPVILQSGAALVRRLGCRFRLFIDLRPDRPLRQPPRLPRLPVRPGCPAKRVRTTYHRAGHREGCLELAHWTRWGQGPVKDQTPSC